MQHQNWDNVTWTKPKTTINQVNTNRTSNRTFNELNSDDPPVFKKISHSLRILLQKARTSKKLTKKELALKVNVKENVISDYENGKVIPDRTILNKLSTILKVKLKLH